MKKILRFKTLIGVLKHLPGMHYLEVPARIVKELGGLKVRLVCTVNKKLSFQCGMVAHGAGKAYISITKKRLKELHLGEGSEAAVELKVDRSKYGMKMSEELKIILQQDVEGNERFHKLTLGKQRYIIQYVSAVKNPDKRIERGMLIIENLKKLPLGKESFREMLGYPPSERKYW